MKIVVGDNRYSLRNEHPFAQAILALAQAYASSGTAKASVPERNDIKQLWRELGDPHQGLLAEIADWPTGISQLDLERRLGLDWQGLRGVHNGLARICERLGIEKPVRVVGYNANNRRYLMDPDIAKTIKSLRS